MRGRQLADGPFLLWCALPGALRWLASETYAVRSECFWPQSVLYAILTKVNALHDSVSCSIFSFLGYSGRARDVRAWDVSL